MSALLELATEELQLTPENGGVVGDWVLCGRRVLLREFYGVRGSGSGRATPGMARCWNWKKLREFVIDSTKGRIRDDCRECEFISATFRRHGGRGFELALKRMHFELKRNRELLGVPVLVTLEEFIANWYRDSPACPECKRPILLNVTEKRCRPSYDRIDSSIKGYVTGNNQFLHFSCNSRKGNRPTGRRVA